MAKNIFVLPLKLNCAKNGIYFFIGLIQTSFENEKNNQGLSLTTANVSFLKMGHNGKTAIHNEIN